MGSNIMDYFKHRIAPHRKAAFFAAVCCGLIAHLYKFTNALPNMDSLQNFYSKQNVLASGRWFLEIACAPSTFFDLPWVTGLLSLLWIAFASALIVEIFEIDNPFLSALIGCFMATFPAVIEVFFYQYTADGYMLALLLGTLGVFLTRPGQRGLLRYVGACICLTCCCGIYQTYVSYALVLTLCVFLFLLLHTQDTKACVRWIAKQAGLYAVSLAAYYAIWQLCMRVQDVVPTNYQGIDRLGTLQLSAVPEKALQVILETGFYFLNYTPGNGKPLPMWTVLHMLFLVAFSSVLIFSILRTKLYRSKGRLILFVVSLTAIPYAAFMWLFATSDMTYAGFRMKHSFCILYILAAVLHERYTSLRWKNAMGALLAVMILTNALTANIHYFYMDRVWDKSLATAAEMAARLHEEDDGEAKYLTVVGREANASTPNYIDKSGLGYYYYYQLNTLLRDELNTARFLGNVLEFSLKYYVDHPDETPNFAVSETGRGGTMNSRISLLNREARDALIASDEVRAMADWPAKGSVQQIGDVLVVKFSDETKKAK